MYSNNFRATVVSATGASALPLGSRVLPAQIPQKADGSPAPEFTYPKAAAYVRTRPEAWVVDDGFIDGCNHVVTVAVRPVSYDDATLSASAYGSVTVRLDYDLCGEDGLTGSKPIFPPRASEYVRIEDLVVNTANVAQFAPRRVPDAGSGEHSRHYYIIVPDNLKDAVDDPRSLETSERLQRGREDDRGHLRDPALCGRRALLVPQRADGGACGLGGEPARLPPRRVRGQRRVLLPPCRKLKDLDADKGKATWAYWANNEIHTFEKYKRITENVHCLLIHIFQT